MSRVSSGLACQLELVLCPSWGADRMDGGPEEGARARQRAGTGPQAGRGPMSSKGPLGSLSCPPWPESWPRLLPGRKSYCTEWPASSVSHEYMWVILVHTGCLHCKRTACHVLTATGAKARGTEVKPLAMYSKLLFLQVPHHKCHD